MSVHIKDKMNLDKMAIEEMTVDMIILNRMLVDEMPGEMVIVDNTAMYEVTKKL